MTNEHWRLQRKAMLRKLVRQRDEIHALKAEVALLRMRVPVVAPPEPPLSEEDDPPIK